MILRHLEFSVAPGPGKAAPIFWRETWPALLGCPGARAVLWNEAVRHRSPLARRCSMGPWTSLDLDDLQERELAAVQAMAQAHFEVFFWLPFNCLGRLAGLWPVRPVEGADLERGLGLTRGRREALESLAATGPADDVLAGFADEGMFMALIAPERQFRGMVEEVTRVSKAKQGP